MDDEKRWCEAGCKRNRQHFEIYPKEGEVWAVLGDWKSFKEIYMANRMREKLTLQLTRWSPPWMPGNPSIDKYAEDSGHSSGNPTPRRGILPPTAPLPAEDLTGETRPLTEAEPPVIEGTSTPSR
ncbi:hypothetical protein IFM89_016870 [Coptis chinensis]|uniref:Uncharacterized protein n=1 Tax=Coptis chinensis TaxID=261450 RepID=A0A835I2R6_9MAGN|nr:hypothetical protein IFM89_016870 [Coptis chinensis]